MTKKLVAYRRDALVETLIYHQRADISGCCCGWAVLGRSFAEHVADVYEFTLSESAET